MANYWYIKFNWCDEKQINLEEINYFWRRHWLQGSRTLSKIGSVPESGSTLVGSNKTIAGGPYRAPFSVILQNQSPAIDKIISIRLYVLYLELLYLIKKLMPTRGWGMRLSKSRRNPCVLPVSMSVSGRCVLRFQTNYRDEPNGCWPFLNCYSFQLPSEQDK